MPDLLYFYAGAYQSLQLAAPLDKNGHVFLLPLHHLNRRWFGTLRRLRALGAANGKDHGQDDQTDLHPNANSPHEIFHFLLHRRTNALQIDMMPKLGKWTHAKSRESAPKPSTSAVSRMSLSPVPRTPPGAAAGCS